jgi:hypothetical protein
MSPAASRTCWRVSAALVLAVAAIAPTARAAGPVENQCVSTVDVPIWCGDGGPAVKAGLVHPNAVAVLPDGSVLIYDVGHSSEGDYATVRRVGRDGVITRVAGTGRAGDTGDGGAARNARIAVAGDIAALPDGGFLIAETARHRVRAVTADGVIRTVVGGGVAGDRGDGGPAVRARLEAPVSVSAAADGSFYIADAGDGRVREVSATGTISTVARVGLADIVAGGVRRDLFDVAALPGGGFAFSHRREVDVVRSPGPPSVLYRAKPARDVLARTIWDLAAFPDGRLLIVTPLEGQVLSLAPDGQVTHFASCTNCLPARPNRGDECRFPPEGAPATAFPLDVLGVVAAPDDTVFVADYLSSRVRRIAVDGRLTTFAGGVGSKSGGRCGFGAGGDDDMEFWASFTVAQIRTGHGRVTATLVSTRPGRATVTLRRGGHVILRFTRSIKSGTVDVSAAARVPPGHYDVSLRGRTADGQTASFGPIRLRVRT